MKRVAFINENTLGHASYLQPFVRALQQRPELGIEPHLINATPLPPELERRANFTVRGLRRWGLDFHAARWRLTVSRHVRSEVNALRRREKVEAIVVNTQSVALELADLARELPIFVCLDATFQELADSEWFAPNAVSRAFLPVTLAPIRARERQLFASARRLLPWSRRAGASLTGDYAVPIDRVSVLPPSIEPPAKCPARLTRQKPQILFMGGDFRRKGGPLLLECFRRRLRGQAELHIVTQSDVAAEADVFVHRGVTAQSDAWRTRWEEADLFVFPSRLETFGIVLLEALAFGVPVISADTGAAQEILADGAAGVILPEVNEQNLFDAITDTVKNRAAALARAEKGRQRIAEAYSLAKNAAQLAGWIQGAQVT